MSKNFNRSISILLRAKTKRHSINEDLGYCLHSCKTAYRQFGKRFALNMDDLERSIINNCLTRQDIRAAFKMMDENSGTLHIL